jgi:hypothetical protein
MEFANAHGMQDNAQLVHPGLQVLFGIWHFLCISEKLGYVFQLIETLKNL